MAWTVYINIDQELSLILIEPKSDQKLNTVYKKSQKYIKISLTSK